MPSWVMSYDELSLSQDWAVAWEWNGITKAIKGMATTTGSEEILADLQQIKMKLTAELIRRECCPKCHDVVPARRVWTQGEECLLVMACRKCKLSLHMHDSE
jgi:RNase P subunit RPR2